MCIKGPFPKLGTLKNACLNDLPDVSPVAIAGNSQFLTRMWGGFAVSLRGLLPKFGMRLLNEALIFCNAWEFPPTILGGTNEPVAPPQEGLGTVDPTTSGAMLKVPIFFEKKWPK